MTESNISHISMAAEEPPEDTETTPPDTNAETFQYQVEMRRAGLMVGSAALKPTTAGPEDQPNGYTFVRNPGL